MRLCLTILAGVLMAQSCGMTPAFAHDHYTDWKQKNGKSCCNSTDCRPAKVRWQPGGWQVQLRGKWCDIPKGKVRPYSHPDRGPHVCASLSAHADSCQMYCYVPGEVKG